MLESDIEKCVYGHDPCVQVWIDPKPVCPDRSNDNRLKFRLVVAECTGARCSWMLWDESINADYIAEVNHLGQVGIDHMPAAIGWYKQTVRNAEPSAEQLRQAILECCQASGVSVEQLDTWYRYHFAHCVTRATEEILELAEKKGLRPELDTADTDCIWLTEYCDASSHRPLVGLTFKQVDGETHFGHQALLFPETMYGTLLFENFIEFPRPITSI